MTYKSNLWIIMFLLLALSLQAQEVLTLEEATKIALENNFDIKIAENDIKIAENQANKGYVGLRPRVDFTTGLRANGASSYRIPSKDSNFPNGYSYFDPSVNLDAAINVSYLLYDGKAAKTSYETLRELGKLSRQQKDLTTEGLVYQIISGYYTAAQLRENLAIGEEQLQITQERIRRARVKFEYATTNKLEILNAEVDLNADSIALVNAHLNYDRAKRNLNRLMNRSINTDFDIRPNVDFLPTISLDSLKAKVLEQNRQLALTQQGITLSLLDLRVAEAANSPTLTFGGGYSISNGTSINSTNPIFSTLYNATGTLQASLNLSYPIYDGGRRKIDQQNGKIAIENSRLEHDRTVQNLTLELENAFADYENALYVLGIEQRNLAKAQQNFLRSQEAFNIGQINSTDFRQAQFNLANLQTRIVNARYSAKLGEMELVRLSGGLF